MPANIDPIFSRSPDIQWVRIPSGTTANTAVDGSGTVFTVFTADSTNGGFVQSIRIKSASTNTSTVIRFFLNNGSTNATPANNTFTDEVALPGISATNTAAVSVFELPIGRAIPAGYKINCCYATSVTGTIDITAFGGKY